MILKKKRINRASIDLGLDQSLDLVQRPGIVLFITLIANEGWLFQWPSTGADHYRIVLQGQQIATVVNTTNGMQSYLYDGAGFVEYPPPLEITDSAALTPSELNKPFIVIQWYGTSTAAYYQVQEYVDSVWVNQFEIIEVGATVYSWSSGLLDDETVHLWRVVAFNSLNQGSNGLAFNMTPVVTPPNFIETDYTVTYDGTGHQIVLALV